MTTPTPILRRADCEGAQQPQVATFSLPLPRELAADLAIDHPCAALHPVGWWERDRLPRRAFACVVDPAGVPETLHLKCTGDAEPPAGASPWRVAARVTRKQLPFVPHRFDHVDQLRGVPAGDCTFVEYALDLAFGDRLLSLQFGATGPDGTDEYVWQNVMVDRLWSNAAVEAVRVGGVIYNGDTYLWADVFLLLFANGVAGVTAHFVNTKLHIKGYDFQGLPFVRLEAPGLSPVDAQLPRDGLRFDLGAAALNMSDAAILFSDEYPAALHAREGACVWYPFSRTFNPQAPDGPPKLWEPGFARTVRFQLSLSDAPGRVRPAPAIARYVVPSWWYGASGEPWAAAFLPVDGLFAPLSEGTADLIRGLFRRGRFDGACAAKDESVPSAPAGNDGYAGMNLMETAYHTGRPDVYADALDYCYYWADLAVDHTDYSIHQWVGGWPWKTCAYTKFRDVIYGWLETADPWLLDTAELCAESHYAWFRSNWPRCSIGRDAFEIGGWALLWRFTRTEHARDRTRELVRMLETVLDAEGRVGGQMGAGPHPGYHSSLYMTGVCMMAVAEATEAALESGDEDAVPAALGMLERLHAHYNRDDVELFPSNLGSKRIDWTETSWATWSLFAARAYPLFARLCGDDRHLCAAMRRVLDHLAGPSTRWLGTGRFCTFPLQGYHHDAALLGATLLGDGVALRPVGTPDLWPVEQTVHTPWGALTVQVEPEAGRLSFQAPETFPVMVDYAGRQTETDSNGHCVLAGRPGKV